MDTNTNGVQFEEGKIPLRREVPVSESNIARWFIKYSGGLIKNEKQVLWIFVILVLVVIILTAIIIRSDSVEPQSGPVPAGQFVPGS